MRYITFLLLFILPLALQAQKRNTPDCRQDSSVYQYWDKYGRNFIDPGRSNVIRQRFFLPENSGRDCFCTLLIYAKVFNTVLLDTIDFAYDVNKNPPVYQYLSHDKKYIEEADRINRRYSIYY
jgi:hypothetical protein